METIKSKKFILRPFRKGDEESLRKNIDDRNIYKHTIRIPFPYRLKDAKEWVRCCISSAKKRQKNSVNFAISADDEVIGGIGFDQIHQHKAEIGYWLGKKYWNSGIMTKAAGLATEFGFNRLKLRRISAYVFLKNNASARVLEKNGYRKEGLLKKYHFKDGKYIDAMLYAKVR